MAKETIMHKGAITLNSAHEHSPNRYHDHRPPLRPRLDHDSRSPCRPPDARCFDTYAAALSHALKCVYRSAQALAFISRNAGREMIARFVKADGTVRRMRFTTPAAPTSPAES